MAGNVIETFSPTRRFSQATSQRAASPRLLPAIFISRLFSNDYSRICWLWAAGERSFTTYSGYCSLPWHG
jgi:hypothetical protein